MKSKLYISFSILFCIATLFMGVGYASINSVSLNLFGNMTAQVQDSVFITDINYNNELSSDVIESFSKVNNSYGCTLSSDIVLSNHNDSKFTYDITVYNSNNFTYIFDGVDYVFGKNTYNNKNISFVLNGLSEGDLLESKESKTFSITFFYRDSNNIVDVSLKSILNFKFTIAPDVVDEYDYSGNVETCVAPHDGVYKLEVWGAQGGSYDSTYYGGHGGYSYGNIILTKGQPLFVIVGGEGVGGCVSTYCEGGYNGGGNSGVSTFDALNFTSSGGGATHIALTNRGELFNYESYKSDVLIVAGGGGGGYYHTSGVNVSNVGGAGGGLSGIDGTLAGIQTGANGDVLNATGGTQISGGIAGYRGASGTFGHGGSGSSCNSDKCGSSGGGGGYYGGGAAGHAGSGGGSGYVGGVIDGVTVAGINSIPSYDGNSTMIGNSGDGYAKISFLKETSVGSVYIESVNYVSSVDIDENDFQIMTFNNTELVSDITLSNSAESEIIYEIEVYNTTNFVYYYDDVYFTNGDNYTNENIIFELDGINTGYFLNPNSSIKFKIKFFYDDISNITSNNLFSVLDFKFIKIFDVNYIGFESDDFLSYALENKTFSYRFSNMVNEIKIKSGDNYLDSSEYSFDGIYLEIYSVVDHIEIINVDGVQIVPDFTFSNEVYTFTMGGYSVYRVNATSPNQIPLSLNGTYDLSNMSYVEFDLFVPVGYNPINLNGVQSQLELGSAGVWDVKEITYGLDNRIYSDLVPGFWNHFVISLSDFSNDEGDGYDITKINFIGLYWNNEDSEIKYTIPNCQIKNFKFSNYIL